MSGLLRSFFSFFSRACFSFSSGAFFSRALCAIAAAASVLAVATPSSAQSLINADPSDVETEPPPLVHSDGPRYRRAGRAEPNSALVFIGDDGGLDFQAVRAIRGLAVGELRRRGLFVVDDVRSEGAMSSAQAQQLMREMRVERGFAVNVQGRLGDKVPLEIEEIAPGRSTQVFAAQLTASSLDECDVVIQRLVDAVLDRRQPGENATMRTVTRRESQPFRKRPGELFWSLGLVIPTFNGDNSSGSPAGGSIGLFYEIENFNFGVEGLFAYSRGLAAGGVFFQGNYLFFDSDVSPFIGGGVGYMGADNGGGLGIKAQLGIEALRLHRVRILVGFEALFPLFPTGAQGGQGFDDEGVAQADADRHILPAFFVHFAF